VCNRSDRFETAAAAILLAGKTEESPKKLVLVIEESYKVKLRGMQAGRISQAAATSSSSPSAAAAASPQTMTNLNEKFDPKSEQFVKLKERILLLERVILHTIGFELSVDHPYKFLVDMCKKLTQMRLVEYVKASDNAPAAGSPTHVYAGMLNSLVQYSMNFANDSMQTSLCLQFVPQKIAAACVYLACHCCKIRPVDPKVTWLDLLGNPDVECLASIVVQITELVTDRKGADAALFDKIRADLDVLKASSTAGATSTAPSGGGDRSSGPRAAAAAKPAAGPLPPPPPPPPPHDAKRQRTH
jgi:cyclin T